MKKYIFFILFLFLSINSVNAENIQLNYTDSSAIYIYSSALSDTNYNISLDSQNIVFYITSSYRYGVYFVDTGIYYNNLSFYHDNNYYLISEKIDINEKTFFWIIDNPLGRNINYTISIYENNNLIQTEYNNYNIFSTSNTFAKTKYTFIDNSIEIIHTYSTTENKKMEIYNYNFENNILLSSFTTDNIIIASLGSVTYYIEYTKIGDKPKSYYTDQLNPIFKLPYKVVGTHFDKDNYLLNILLITSYLLKALFFWIVVLYKSLFTIIIIILIGVIPFISFVNSRNRKGFIHNLFNNYKLFIIISINIIKYICHLILELLKVISNLIPFT